jgi:hypothetical protein
MRRWICAALLFATACESQRGGKNCIGIGEDKEPGVKYEYSTQNIVVGIIFVETIFVPAIVLLKDIRCPVEAPPTPAAAPAGGEP